MDNNREKIEYRLRGAMKHETENMIFQDIDQRLTLLEEATFKKLKRLRATEAQRFLLHYYLGGIKTIQETVSLSQNQKDLLVSVMLDIDQDNAKKFFAELSKKVRPKLETEANYNFLVEVFSKLGLTHLEGEAEKVLTKIRAAKGQ